MNNLLTFFFASTPQSGTTPPQLNTGHQPNSELDMAAGFVLMVVFTRDDEDENLDSIRGVYVDDSIGTSISSVSRVTKPANSPPTSSWG